MPSADPDVDRWLSGLKQFSRWDSLGGSATQVSSRAAEDFFESVTKKYLPRAWPEKLSTQERMDFAILPREGKDAIIRAGTGPTGRHPTERRLKTWQSSEANTDHIEIVFVQVKSGSNGFTLNDTFPPPFEDMVYAFFNYGAKEVYVTTSSYMASAWQTEPPIADRYLRSDAAEKGFDETLREIWRGTPVGTAARPTYRIEARYAKSEPPGDVFASLLRRAKVL